MEEKGEVVPFRVLRMMMMKVRDWPTPYPGDEDDHHHDEGPGLAHNIFGGDQVVLSLLEMMMKGRGWPIPAI